MKMTTLAVGLFLVAAFSLTGCDPVSRHKALSTLFDGVPSLPPPEQHCADYADKKVAELRDELSGKKVQKVDVAASKSLHLPYQEKKCDGCHDKSKKDGLVAPRRELCFVCHKGFIKAEWVHGPVAVSDCLSCHVPHNSAFPSLLKADRNAVCASCHQEKRLAAVMHDRVMAQQMACIDCHDPHFGNAAYFLK